MLLDRGRPSPDGARTATAGCAPGPSGLRVRLHVVDRLLDRRDLLGFFVGDLGLELVLERHDELDGVERDGSEVVDERGLVLDVGLVDAELFGHDLLDALFDVFHSGLPCCSALTWPTDPSSPSVPTRPGLYSTSRLDTLRPSRLGRIGRPASRDPRRTAAIARSFHVHPAVYVQRHARNVAGLRGREKRDRRGDVVRLAEAA